MSNNLSYDTKKLTNLSVPAYYNTVTLNKGHIQSSDTDFFNSGRTSKDFQGCIREVQLTNDAKIFKTCDLTSKVHSIALKGQKLLCLDNSQSGNASVLKRANRASHQRMKVRTHTRQPSTQARPEHITVQLSRDHWLQVLDDQSCQPIGWVLRQSCSMPSPRKIISNTRPQSGKTSRLFPTKECVPRDVRVKNIVGKTKEDAL